MDAIADRIEISDGTTAAEGNRQRARWIWWGLGIGLVVGLVVAGVHVAIVGYHILPVQFVFYLVMFPYFGLLIGFNRYKAHYQGTWRWRRPQFRTGTLMWVVAYVAFLFGMGTWTDRLGSTARQYYQKYVAADSMARTFREQGGKSGLEVEKRRRNVEEFREGKIPAGLLPSQVDFLRNLDNDPKAPPDFRKYRRGLIRDGEQMQLTLQEGNVVAFRKLAEYHGKLARKYDQARWHPWLPVEPDPTPP